MSTATRDERDERLDSQAAEIRQLRDRLEQAPPPSVVSALRALHREAKEAPGSSVTRGLADALRVLDELEEHPEVARLQRELQRSETRLQQLIADIEPYKTLYRRLSAAFQVDNPGALANVAIGAKDSVELLMREAAAYEVELDGGLRQLGRAATETYGCLSSAEAIAHVVEEHTALSRLQRIYGGTPTAAVQSAIDVRATARAALNAFCQEVDLALGNGREVDSEDRVDLLRRIRELRRASARGDAELSGVRIRLEEIVGAVDQPLAQTLDQLDELARLARSGTAAAGDLTELRLQLEEIAGVARRLTDTVTPEQIEEIARWLRRTGAAPHHPYRLVADALDDLAAAARRQPEQEAQS